MKNSDNKIDDLIREALDSEESKFYDSLEEPSLLEEAIGLLKGRRQWITTMTVVVMFVFLGVAVYSAMQFFGATELPKMLTWLGVFFFSFGAIAAIKIWSWMEMDKNAIMREMKRLELQISFLSRKLDSK